VGQRGGALVAFVRDNYVCRRIGKKGNKHSRGRILGKNKKDTAFVNFFIVRATPYSGKVALTNVSFPTDFVGKKIRFRIEVVHEEVD